MAEKKHYDDTADGAIQLLKENSNFEITSSTSDQWTAVPDPEVSGCWKVMVPEDGRADHAVIVYLGDHPLAPDFE